MFHRQWDVRMKSHHQAIAPIKALAGEEQLLYPYLQEERLPKKERCIYIHVPFCSKICSFCNMQRKNCMPPANYADLVIRQIEQYSTIPYIQEGTFDSVYFGGGTPTTLSTMELRKILQALKRNFRISADAEVSMESSISELTDDKLEMLGKEGVNRFSIGVQTFSDRGRRVLGRIGSGEYAAKRLEHILDLGFLNTNIDMIYNYPDQTLEELQEDMGYVQDINIAGVSYYSLILNEGSALTKQLDMSDGLFSRVMLEKDHRFWGYIYAHLLKQEFELLELTKLVRKNRDQYRYIRIRHNYGDTLPLGAGAGGKIGDLMLYTPGDAAVYEKIVSLPLKMKYKGRRMSDIYHYGYRQIGKLQLGRLDIEEHPQIPFVHDLYKEFCAEMIQRGLADMEKDQLVLNKEGIFWGNNIANHYGTIFVEKIGLGKIG